MQIYEKLFKYKADINKYLTSSFRMIVNPLVEWSSIFLQMSL